MISLSGLITKQVQSCNLCEDGRFFQLWTCFVIKWLSEIKIHFVKNIECQKYFKQFSIFYTYPTYIHICLKCDEFMNKKWIQHQLAAEGGSSCLRTCLAAVVLWFPLGVECWRLHRMNQINWIKNNKSRVFHSWTSDCLYSKLLNSTYLYPKK